VTGGRRELAEFAESVAGELRGLPLLLDRDPESRVVAVTLDEEEGGLLHVRWVLDGATHEYDASVRADLTEDASFVANLIRWEIVERVETGEFP
jgi:hypothetical protein